MTEATETQLAKLEPEQFFISNAIQDGAMFQEAARRLNHILGTGLVPSHIKTPQQAMTAIEMGHSLGMGVLESLRSVQVVQGRPCLTAAAIGSLIKRRFGEDAFRVVKQGDDGCVIRVKQINEKGETEFHDVEFLESHAKSAGLAGGAMWKKYAADMYYARCISRVQKRFFQHLGGGDVWIAELVDRKPTPKTLGDL